MRRVQLAGLLSLLVLLVSAGPAAAASPTASTGAASAVTYTKATLSGTVNLQGAPLVSCAFMYGTAAPVSTPVPCSPMPSPSGGATTVTAAITGLTAGTTYQYQLVLTVVGLPPVVQGGIATFATIAAPAVATTAATGIFSTAATLNGTVNPEGATISNCHFIYGTNPAVLSSTAPCSSSPSGTSAVPVSAALSGLSANTPYFYELVATGGVGGETSSVTSSPPQTFTTSNTPPPPPKALTSVAYPIGLTTATVYGYLNGEGVGIGNCHFEYGTTTSYGSTAPCSPSKLATSTANQLVSAALSRLTKDTTYHYQLVVSTAGGTVKGGDASLTTTPPSATTGTATAITQTGATLNGTANPGGNAAYVCGFQYGTTTAYGSTSKCATTPTGSSPVPVGTVLAGLAAGTTYHFRLVVITAAGVAAGTDAIFATSKAYPVKPALKKPNTVITKAAINRRKHQAGFRFKATVAHATGFQCALVTIKHGKAGKPHYTSCRSPKIYKHLKKGSYEFFVRARNAAGFDPTPATKKFKI